MNRSRQNKIVSLLLIPVLRKSEDQLSLIIFFILYLYIIVIIMKLEKTSTFLI